MLKLHAKQVGRVQSVAAAWLLVCLALTVSAHGEEPSLRVGALRWGPGSYRPGQWATLQTDLVNPTNESRHVTVVMTFDPLQRVQFATTVWLPPFSKREVLQPVRMPDQQRRRRHTRHNAVTTVLIDEQTGAELDREESLITTESGGALVMLLADTRRRSMLEALVRIQPPSRPPGMPFGAFDIPDETDGPLVEMPVAPGIAAMPGPFGMPAEDHDNAVRLRVLQPAGVPYYVGGWSGVDCMAIGDDIGQLDPAQEEALRRWLNSGGTVWIALDHLDVDNVRRVFGDMFDCQVVGRVPLNEWTIESPDGSQWPMQSDRPVSMTQVIADGFEPVHTVDGWPASLQRRVGAGRMFITTLSARGWLTREGDPLEPLVELGEVIYRPQPHTSLFEYVDLEPLLVQPDRAPMADLQDAVLRILLVMTAVLVVSGLWLARRDRLDRLAVVTVMATGMTAVLFIALGRVRQRDMPAAAAVVQMARVEQPGEYAVFEGMLAVRAPSSVRAPISASNGELVWPRTLTGQQQFRRMLWSDADRWAWYLPKLPPRLAQPASVSHVAPLASPAVATMRPADRGWYVQVAAESFEPLELTAIAGPSGVVPLSADDSGRLMPRFDPDNPFIDQSAAWGNPKDERLTLLRSLVDHMNVQEPVLAALASRTDDGGVQFDPQLSARRLTYLTLPLTWTNLQHAVLPPAMIRCTFEPDVPNVLHVHLPEALNGMQVTRARVEWRAVNAVPYVLIAAGSIEQRVELAVPAATGVIELNDQMLGAFEQGELRLAFDMDGTPLLQASVCATVTTRESESDDE